MRLHIIALGAGFASLAGACRSGGADHAIGLAADADVTAPDEGVVPLEERLAGWPEASIRAANDMITKYGEPNEVTDNVLVWHNTGDFLHTIVFKNEVLHNFPAPHTDVLQQFIAYDVPPGAFSDLARFDGSVMAERTKGVLSARCDEEGANYLALNLANEIVNRTMSWEEARVTYGEQITLHMNGEPAPYMDGLMFTPRRELLGDPDVSIIDVSGMPGGHKDY